LILSAATAGQQALLLAPLVLVWLALMVAALQDLYRRPTVRGSKLLWCIAIVFVSTIGPIAYFIFGRTEA
jgi:hypothetical protein